MGYKIFILLKTLKNTQTKPKTQKSLLSHVESCRPSSKPPSPPSRCRSITPKTPKPVTRRLLLPQPTRPLRRTPKSRHPLVLFKPNESHHRNPSSYSSFSHLVLRLMDLVFFFFVGIVYRGFVFLELRGGDLWWCGFGKNKKNSKKPKIIIIIIIMWNIKE